MKRFPYAFVLIISAILLNVGLYSQVPFNTIPSWMSTPASYNSTGAGWADINGDGWLDLVIANGNDISRRPVIVYINNQGTMPTTASWQSSDIDYHGHLSIGDINADGYPDVAVSVYLGTTGFSTKGKVKIYKNNNGILSSTPYWTSLDSMYSFSCSFGDADCDGDLDLAVACGEGYNNRPDKSRIYYNTIGIFSSLPGWRSSDISYAMDVGWADFNNDGKLDLVFANEGNHPNRIYLNYGDSIGTIASWSSTDASKYANSLFTGDINNDGFIDLAISDNNQLGGTGKFKIYLNNSGTLSSIPFWQSAFSGYGSGINLADIDFDNDLDLVTGMWWGPCRIYPNTNGNFNTAPQWTSSTNSVVEAIVFGDYNRSGLDTTTTLFTGNGIKKVFYNSRKPVYKIIYVKVTGNILPLTDYCYDLENGWFSFRNVPSNGSQVEIKSLTSHSLDFAVSNWDAGLGNYIFNNNYVIGIKTVSTEIPREFKLHQNYPNPFNPETKITFGNPSEVFIQLNVFEVTGKEIATLVNEKLRPGTYTVSWNASDFSSGVYLYKLTAGNFSQTKKMVLIK